MTCALPLSKSWKCSLRERPDSVSFAIPHDYGDTDQIDAGAEGGGVVRGKVRSILNRSRRLLREGIPRRQLNTSYDECCRPGSHQFRCAVISIHSWF